MELVDDDYEDEDVDFNLLLNSTPSLEASSSLSSEIEGLDADANESGVNKSKSVNSKFPSNTTGEDIYHTVNDYSKYDEDIMIKGANSLLTSHSQPVIEKDNDGVVGGPNNTTDFQNPVFDFDDNDAICRRTRARYSLASFTLDELETFLQESDDDNFRNPDDEEEYRKFLSAVLQSGNDEGQVIPECENVDDDDEFNDTDFQIELEEVLESDHDELFSEIHKDNYEPVIRRPETRQNKRKKAADHTTNKGLGQTNRPLRLLLPLIQNAYFPSHHVNYLTSESPPFRSSISCGSISNVFTPHQIGHLHCLIHEHVQLLIQIFSLSVLEPGQQHIASQVQCLILELRSKRDEVLAWKSTSYPSFLFGPPYTCSSVQDELPKTYSTQFVSESFQNLNTQQKCSENNNVPLSHTSSPSKVSHGQFVSDGQVKPFQTTEGISWRPCIKGPILSVLDVAPLSLVEKYMDGVSTAKQEYRRLNLEGNYDIRSKREPLFPSFSGDTVESARVHISPVTCTSPIQLPKKTMSAAIIENIKKQSVALVPGNIAKLNMGFLPLFNSALYPHKPPVAPVANRILFTDTEDELLALGLMEYNTDWKAIQQRFLPCKSKHQIFIRQKNRCTTKAPDNPIKAVRMMKTSPLTEKEIKNIHEGLKTYKLDWMSIWKFMVPYRDPSLLPRQWRIALGTQKSYKIDPVKKEKRRSYLLKKKRGETGKETSQTENNGEENNTGDDCIDNDDEAYVHEAFLSNWKPNSLSERTHLNGHASINRFEESQPHNGHVHSFLSVTNPQRQLNYAGHYETYTMKPNHPVSDMTLKPSKPQVYLRPYRARKKKLERLVKLAPGLPPVNLPPSVRVMSRSAFKSYHSGESTKVFSANICGDPSTEGRALRLSHAAKSKLKDIYVEDRGPDPNLQLHPLLFQSPGNGCLPYYPMNCSTSTSASFNFSSRNQPQLQLSLFHNSRHENPIVNDINKPLKSNELTSKFSGIDFHPLLQRTKDINRALISHNDGKVNELDLNINLSSVRNELIESNEKRSTENLPNCINAIETQGTSPHCDNGENFPLRSIPNRINAEHVSGSYEFSTPENGNTRCIIDNTNDQSLSGIVMEREELSDSDEEIGEHVEFECEEMADSEEDEGSECERMANIQNEELRNVATEKVVTDEELQDGNALQNVCVKGKHTNTSLGLSLIPSAPAYCGIQNSKHVKNINMSPSGSKRSCKKPLQTITRQKPHSDKAFEGSITLRKLRTRSCKVVSNPK